MLGGSEVGSKLQAAMDWASRGFRVFPLVSNGKEPMVSDFGTVASDDPSVLAQWWRDPVTHMERDYNVGVLTTDIVVVDIDVKNDKPGLANYGKLGGHWDTLVVSTPSGGYHAYFYGPDSANTYPEIGVDIRSHNGYVLAPGSSIGGKEYAILVDKPMAWTPPDIERTLRQPGKRVTREHIVDLDMPNSIVFATDYLLTQAAIAQEGLGGDNTTYQVACVLLRDYALSEEITCELMLRHWNERCEPPWRPDDLYLKIENAEEYATGASGSKLPQATLGTINAIPAPQTAESITQALQWGNALDAAHIPARPWLVTRILMRRDLTILTAGGSAGKSALSLVIAAHGALGLDIGPYKCRQPFKTIVYNAEDGLEEQSRRLFAICQEYKLDYSAVRNRILLLSRKQLPVCLASNFRGSVSVDEVQVQALTQIASDPDVGLLILDPLINLHNCDESDNGQMAFVMSTLHRIADSADVSILIPHHTNKPIGGTARAGNADSSRGASAIVNSARIVLTLFGVSDEDREAYGIREEEKHTYVRLDDAKMNMTLASGTCLWFKKLSHKMFNSDEVGVLRMFNLEVNKNREREFMAMVCADAMKDSGSITVNRAIAALKDADALYERQGDARIRANLERALKDGIKVNEKTVTFVREGEKISITLT